MAMDKVYDAASVMPPSDHGGRARFAWLPKRMASGRWIWLRTYRARRSHFRQ